MVWLEAIPATADHGADIVFAADRRRAMAIAQGLASADFHTPWECESRPEHFDAELLRQMALAGCTTIKIGVESASPELLVAIGRAENEAEARQYLTYVIRLSPLLGGTASTPVSS